MNEELFLKYDGLICKLCKKFYNADFSDLKQAGYLGLLKAYKNFNSGSGAKFSTYAYEYIFGEMYEVASKNNVIKLNKSALKIYKDIIRAKDLLTQKLSRPITFLETAEYLNIDYNDVVDIINSLNISLIEETNYDKLGHNPKIDDLILLKESLESLSEEERNIIKIRYLDDYTQEETAKKLGLSQVKVSRIEKKSKEKMRNFITS